MVYYNLSVNTCIQMLLLVCICWNVASGCYLFLCRVKFIRFMLYQSHVQSLVICLVVFQQLIWIILQAVLLVVLAWLARLFVRNQIAFSSLVLSALTSCQISVVIYFLISTYMLQSTPSKTCSSKSNKYMHKGVNPRCQLLVV